MSLGSNDLAAMKGYCGWCHGSVELDDWCCDYYIGFIDAEGLAWESREERDTTIGANSFYDDWRRWARCGGLVGDEPRPLDYFERCLVLPENQEEMVRLAWDLVHNFFNVINEERAEAAAPLN